MTHQWHLWSCHNNVRPSRLQQDSHPLSTGSRWRHQYDAHRSFLPRLLFLLSDLALQAGEYRRALYQLRRHPHDCAEFARERLATHALVEDGDMVNLVHKAVQLRTIDHSG